MQIEIKKFITQESTKLVGFHVTNNNGALFVIDKEVPLGSGKTEEQYVQEAMALAQNEIDDWLKSQSIIGRKWNPQTNSFE